MATQQSGSNTTSIASKSADFRHPDWDSEMEVRERPLWQIAAMAGDIRPLLRVVRTERTINAAWSAGYFRMIRILTDALHPRRSNKKIFFDVESPANITRINEKKDLRNVRVDVASATTFLITKYGADCLPAGLLRLHHHVCALASEKHVPANEVSSPAPAPAGKSQELRQATTKNKTLTKLLYAVVESAYGWSSSAETSRVGTLRAIRESLDRLELGSSRYGLSSESITETLNLAAEEYPVRKELQQET